MREYHLRFKVNPNTLGSGLSTLIEIGQTVNGIDSIVTRFKLKRTYERQQRIVDAIETVRNLSNIASGIASSVKTLFRK